MERHGIRFSLAFIDGMHWFEFALRDFINAERQAAPGSTILVHDVCPWTSDMERRELEQVKGAEWTGDVWKLIPILLEHRPDLNLRVYDCTPTGLLSITGLDPGNRVLAPLLSDLATRYGNLRLSDFGGRRFADMFSFASAQAEHDAGYPSFRSARPQS